MKYNSDDTVNPQITTSPEYSESTGGGYSNVESTGGITLEVYLAGRAMQGLLSNPNIIKAGSFEFNYNDLELISNRAALAARSLIKRLNKEEV